MQTLSQASKPARTPQDPTGTFNPSKRKLP